MSHILEGILKGLLEWGYSLILEIVEYIANGLLDVFSMDLAYFESVMPITGDILNIIIASGWALLIGNLVFQAAKSMMSGLGFEGEDPKTLFARTFVFGFLLLASRQVCDIGLGISNTIITMLQVPSSVSVSIPGEDVFSIGASWLLMILVGLVLMWQLVKLFLEIGERYFLVGFLTMTAPWAFAMGGSRNTADIFKGWARMFASMCLMMVMNVVFLKLFLSAMGNMPDDAGVIPWIIFVIAIARVARKIDSVIVRIGLNPALTGDGLGRGLPGVLSYMVIKSVASSITKSAASAAGKTKTPPNAAPPPNGASPAGTRTAPAGGGNPGNRGSAQSTSATQNNSTSQQSVTNSAGASPPSSAASASAATSGAAGRTANTTVNQGQFTQQSNTNVRNATGPAQNNVAKGQAQSAQANASRYSSFTGQSTARSPVFGAGAAGTAGGASPSAQNASTVHPPIPRGGQPSQSATSDVAGSVSQGERKAPRPARYSSVPPNSHPGSVPGAAGTLNISGGSVNARSQQGGVSVNAQSQNSINTDESTSRQDFHAAPSHAASSTQRQNATAGARSAANSTTPGAAGTGSRRSSAASADPAGRTPAQTSRGGGNTAAPPPEPRPTSAGAPARQEGVSRNTDSSRITRQPSPGAAGKTVQANTGTNTGKKTAPNSAPPITGQHSATINGASGVNKKSGGGKKKNRKGKGAKQ